VPADVELLSQCEPIYAEFEGWRTATNKARKWKDLPAKAKRIEGNRGTERGEAGHRLRRPGREQTIFVS